LSTKYTPIKRMGAAPTLRSVHLASWHHVRFASRELARRFTVDQQFPLAIGHVTDFVSGMGVATGIYRGACSTTLWR
jgi:hypothetical protein